MPNLFHRVRSGQAESRYSLEDYGDLLNEFYYAGNAYAGLNQTYHPRTDGRVTEQTAAPFEQWVQGVYKSNGIVFACQVARLTVFSQARFQWQRVRNGKPGDFFGTTDLGILERPWTNGSTAELLSRMIQDADLSGNAYIRRTGPLVDPALERLRPDWVDIVLGERPGHLTLDVVGYLWYPEGRGKPDNWVALNREEVAHWSPYPDPIATYRGMSWLTPVLREIQADAAATTHKKKFFDNAATPNMVVSFDPTIKREALEKFKLEMDSEHRGISNAYKTLYLGGGADVSVVGSSFEQMDFKRVQGAGETRIAAAARVPPIIVGLSEGLDAATYSNYGQARRHFADGCLHHLWGSASDALAAVVPPPSNARLWYEHSHIPFLREDEKDAADIESVKAQTIAALVREGFEPKSVIAAVTAQDMRLLVHTGALSVQLTKPGEGGQPDEPDDDDGQTQEEPSMNGNGRMATVG